MYNLFLKGDGEPILEVLRYIFYIQMKLYAGTHGIIYSAMNHHARDPIPLQMTNQYFTGFGHIAK